MDLASERDLLMFFERQKKIFGAHTQWRCCSRWQSAAAVRATQRRYSCSLAQSPCATGYSVTGTPAAEAAANEQQAASGQSDQSSRQQAAASNNSHWVLLGCGGRKSGFAWLARERSCRLSAPPPLRSITASLARGGGAKWG